jgi:hypothetical protein
MLPLMTTRAEPVLFEAKRRIIAHTSRQWPDLDIGEVTDLADAIVRLTISHVVLPMDPPETVADRLARLVARYLDGAWRTDDRAPAVRHPRPRADGDHGHR